jgi:hypothetical protein
VYVSTPKVVLAVAASASSRRSLIKELKVVTAAVPDPVKYGSAFAAEVNPAIAPRFGL